MSNLHRPESLSTSAEEKREGNLSFVRATMQFALDHTLWLAWPALNVSGASKPLRFLLQ